MGFNSGFKGLTAWFYNQVCLLRGTDWMFICRVELRLSGLIWTAGHPDMQIIRIIGFFFENRLRWQFAVRLLLFTVCTCV